MMIQKKKKKTVCLGPFPFVDRFLAVVGWGRLYLEPWSHCVALGQPDFELHLMPVPYRCRLHAPIHLPRFHRDLTIVSVQGDLMVVSVHTHLTIKRGT